MHIHLCCLKNGNNIVADRRGTLSREALKIIGGILKFAPSLAAFGNPTPISYLRFVARKESPMHICWSAGNRLAVIRVPLGWYFKKTRRDAECCRETFEYRASDAFANAHLLFAGLAIAAQYGLKNCKDSLKLATDVHADAAEEESKNLKVLPRSCGEAAERLERDRLYYEANAVFPKRLMDETVKKLKAFEDRSLAKESSRSAERIKKTVMEYVRYA